MSSWKEKVALIAQGNRQEIVKAKLSRREMIRAGLVTAGGSLVAKHGLSTRAYAALTDPDTSRNPPSPPTRAWISPMPMLTVAKPVDSHDMLGGAPTGFTPIDGATKSIQHQYCSYDANTSVYGGGAAGSFPPQKFYELEMKETSVSYHPDYNVAGKPATKVWAFGDPNNGANKVGTVPGPLIQAKYGEPIMVRFHNHLPSVKVPQSFGIAEMTTHLHNAHTPSESDGNPVNYFNSINDPNAINPMGFKDQHYPNVLAGFTDPKYAATAGDPREALSSLWYHDHHLDYTAQNVYKGMFGCYTLFDDKDTGDETKGLRLPSGKYDVPIFVNDVVFDANVQPVFDLFNLDGILGDKLCANGAIQPYMQVDKRRYRFRLYNPGPSRWYEFSLFDGVNFLPFWQISSDGNLLTQPIQTTSVRVSVAERVDIVVDFGKIAGRTLYLVNRLEQINGRGPTGRILTPGTPVIQFRNYGSPATDNSIDLSTFTANNPYFMRDLPDSDFAALQAKAATLPTRTWEFARGSGGWTVNGKLFDENVVSAAIPRGAEEVWVIRNPGGDWRHPIHIHFEEHRTLSRNGVAVKPNTQFNASVDYARKDVIQLNTNEEIRIFMRFRDMRGRYVMHCHNVVHEDHAMMVRWDIV